MFYLEQFQCKLKPPVLNPSKYSFVTISQTSFGARGTRRIRYEQKPEVDVGVCG